MLIFRDEFSSSQLKMFTNPCTRKLRTIRAFAVLCGLILAGFFCSAARAQQTAPASPVVVQPGAPGQPSRRLPPATTAKLPPWSQADVEFMQGMIMHHAQAVEMTALIPSHAENKEVRLLGVRISSSQSDEIKFMRRWLVARGEPLSMAMPGMDISHESMHLMPAMLTPEQMPRSLQPRRPRRNPRRKRRIRLLRNRRHHCRRG